MARETHILRFKVVTVECATLPNGQQYTIMYQRGSTNRSTPCYTAQGGFINFSAMPEGAAVVHFKSGHGGRRYAPKFIRFMVEEYTPGMPRRLVGETEVDCTQVLTSFGESGGGVLTSVLRMYGNTAKMKVAVLVYPQHAPALSFEGLMATATERAKPQKSHVEVLERSRGLALLISLETMLERRQATDGIGGGSATAAPSQAQARLQELQERRKALVGAEGLATAVMKARCEDAVAVQFVSLARRCRANYIGETAAYLRQMALTSGESVVDEEGNAPEEAGTVQEQLGRVSRRLEELQGQIRKLEEEQMALGRIQHQTDVTAELCANLDKVATLEVQVKTLEESKAALAAAVQKQAAVRDTPLAREVADIHARIQTLTAEQQQLQSKVDHMVYVGSTRALAWARSKNPPEPDTTSSASQEVAGPKKTAVDDLFSDSPSEATEQTTYNDFQRRQIVDALKGMQTSAPPPTVHSPTSASSSSGHRTPRDIFADAGLPSMGDFNSAVAQKKAAAAAAAEKPPVKEDPLRPSGLGQAMFSAKPEAAAAAPSGAPPGLPSMSDFQFGATAATSRRDEAAAPMFDFGAVARASAAPAASNDNQMGFALEPEMPSAVVDSVLSTRPQPLPAAVTVSKKDDPYYDEMDDFTVPPELTAEPATIEFTDGFGGFGSGAPEKPPGAGMTASSPSPATAGPPSAAMRPVFNFGPSDEPSTTIGAGFELDESPATTYNFTSSGGGGGTSGYSNLPTYNFGS